MLRYSMLFCRSCRQQIESFQVCVTHTHNQTQSHSHTSTLRLVLIGLTFVYQQKKFNAIFLQNEKTNSDWVLEQMHQLPSIQSQCLMFIQFFFQFVKSSHFHEDINWVERVSFCRIRFAICQQYKFAYTRIAHAHAQVRRRFVWHFFPTIQFQNSS